MKRFNKYVRVSILLGILALVLKKQLVPGASALLIFAISILTVLFFTAAIRSVFRKQTDNSFPLLFILAGFVFAISGMAFLSWYQHWAETKTPITLGFTGLILTALLAFYYLIFLHSDYETEKRIYTQLLIPFIFFLFLISFSMVTNQRQFHNFFKGSTFESYVRLKYPMEEARVLLEENQCNDPSCIQSADEYYMEGLRNDSLQNWDQAYACYNKAIDNNLHFSKAYVARAANRMLHTVVDADIVKYALLDCTIAIDLEPSLAAAYLRRGYTYIYAKQREKACADFIKAKELDNSLKLAGYISSNCK